MSSNICPKCEYDNMPEAAACSRCLAPLHPQSSGEQSSSQRASNTAPGSQRVERPAPVAKPVSAGFNAAKLIPIVIVVLVIAIAGWWFFLRPASPDQVVRNFIAASESGDSEKMKACLSSADIQMFTQMPGGEASITNAMKSSAGKSSETEVGAVVYQGEKALVSVAPKNPSSQGMMGAPMKMDMILIKEDGKWKISLQETMQNMIKSFMMNMPKGMPGAGGGMPGR